MPHSLDAVHRSRSGIHDLPSEILSHVFDIYTSLRPQPPWAQSLEAIRATRQLQLRLVCKRWAEIIIARYFRVVDIREPKRLRVLLANWTTLYADAPVYSEQRCPVLKLKVDSVWYHKPYDLNFSLPETEKNSAATCGPSSGALASDLFLDTVALQDGRDPFFGGNQFGSFSNPQEDESDSIANLQEDEELAENVNSVDQVQSTLISQTQLCSMDATIQILELLGRSLTSLEITFVNSFAFPPALVAAMRRMKFLQRLDINYHYRRQVPLGLYRKGTLSHLLRSVPQLQTLNLQCGKFLPDFTGSRLALPQLRSLGLLDLMVHSDKGILSLCNLVKHHLRSLEIISDNQNTSYILPMLQRVRKTLQALNVNRKQLALVSDLEFPQLQVFGPTDFDFDLPKTEWEDSQPEKNWIHSWPMLRNVRTLAIAPKGCWTAMLGYFFDCWKTSNQKDSNASSTTMHREGPFKLLPNLRFVVFVPRFPAHIPLEFLKTLFARHKIEIHAGDYHHLREIEQLDQLLHAPFG